MLQLLKVMDIWTKILDEGGSIEIIYCDFMKAFDKVPHKRLIHKIQKYGIDGNILGWMESFLTNRTQQIVINDEKSNSAFVTSGIPQGSVLGPILFVLYINDLPEVVDQNTFIFLFADDTKAFRQITNEADQKQLQRDINEMVAWSNKWLLRFHPQKCTMMKICKDKSDKESQYEYTMEGHPLPYSTCEKDIGVHIDSNLNFDKHINYSINKANRVLAITKRTFDYMDEEIFLQLYKGLVRPQLEYASSVWAPHLMKHIDALEAIQRRATKQIPGFEHLSYSERLRKLKLPTLSYRRARGDLIQVFKLLHCEVGFDKSLPNFFDLSHNTHLRGHSKKIFVHGSNKDIRKFSFKHRVVKIWNSLPENVIDSATVWQFENNLDKYWKNQPILYDDYKAGIQV